MAGNIAASHHKRLLDDSISYTMLLRASGRHLLAIAPEKSNKSSKS